MEIVTDYPKLPQPVVTGVPLMATGGLRWSVSTGNALDLKILAYVWEGAEMSKGITLNGHRGKVKRIRELSLKNEEFCWVIVL